MTKTHAVRAAAVAALVFGVSTAAATIRAEVEGSRTTYLTFSKPVALPGVTLRSGTYIFEVPAPDTAPDVVRVLSRDRKTVYFTAFTNQIDRPDDDSNTRLVSFKEVAPDMPPPIAVWWSDPMKGRQFVYAAQ